MAMLRSAVGLALRRSAPAPAASRFFSNAGRPGSIADLALRGSAPPAAASRFRNGGCGSPRFSHTKMQQLEKSIEKSKKRLLDLYLDNSHESKVESVAEELDHLIRRLEAKARCSKSSSKIEEQAHRYFLDNVAAPTMFMVMVGLCIHALAAAN